MAGPQLRGREPEQAILAGLIAGTADGKAGVVLLDGAGIGKSRPVEDAARLAAEHGFTVAAARSDELDQVTPLGPLITALRGSEPPIISRAEHLLLPGLADQRLWLLDQLHAALEPLGLGLRVLTEIQIRRGDLAAAKAMVGQLRPLLARQQATATVAWAPALLADAQGDPDRAVAELAEPLGMLAERHYRLGVPDPPRLAQLTALRKEHSMARWPRTEEMLRGPR